MDLIENEKYFYKEFNGYFLCLDFFFLANVIF